MASSGAPAARKHLRVLLPFSRSILRIPDELAAEIGPGEALVVVPSGSKQVWPVEVGQDGDGAFLGHGWQAFADACGVGGGWLVVLRHCGRGVLTVKAFDDSGCLRELGTPIPPPAEGARGIKETARKPQFICVLPTDFMQKMLIPAKFVQRYIPKEHLNNHMASILGPLGKVYTIQLEMDQLDFFTGGWSQFVAFHGITEVDFLRLRYEGNMSFTIKVFGSDGFPRECKHMEIRGQQKAGKQQEAPSDCIKKHKCKNKATLRKLSYYKIGPPSWIRKQINFNALERELSLAPAFCGAIRLQEPCTITLKTSMDSTKSWLVRGFQCKKGSYLLAKGWKLFCQEKSLKEGDICTFNVIKTTLWHVVIMRRFKEQINHLRYETTSLSNKKRKIIYERSGGKGPKRPKGSMTSLNKASSKKRGVFEIGPPAWITKKDQHQSLRKMSLPTASLLQGYWNLGTFHDHTKDVNEQHQVLASAYSPIQAFQPPCCGVRLEDVLSG